MAFIDYVSRAMRQDDVDALFHLEATINEYSWSKQNFADCVCGPYVSEVFLDTKGNITAFYIGQTVSDEFHLLNIGVAKPAQRQGLGTYILTKIKRQSQGQKLKKILLEVRQSNKNALALYLKHGFVKCGTRRAYYPTVLGREDAILMTCILDE